MNCAEPTCGLLEESNEIIEDLTGLSGGNEQPVRVRAANHRPLSMAWISDELLAKTIDVWSDNYGRPVSEDEAVEILMNVKRLAESLADARREMNNQ